MTSRSDLSTKVPVDGNVPAKAFVLEVHTDAARVSQALVRIRRHGEQFTHHAQFIQMVISRFARLVESIEALSLGFDPLNEANATTLQDTDAGGASFTGMPIGIRFSRPIPDLPAFCE